MRRSARDSNRIRINSGQLFQNFGELSLTVLLTVIDASPSRFLDELRATAPPLDKTTFGYRLQIAEEVAEIVCGNPTLQFYSDSIRCPQQQ